MASRGPAYDVLLAGYFGFGNLGDELLIRAALENLDELGIPPERTAILSNDLDGTRNRFGVDAFDRWKISSVARAVSSSRSLLLPGGGLFQDSTSVKSCVYYWGLVRTAVPRSLPVAALGQSVGPLSRALSKCLTKNAFSRCKYAAVRDNASREMLSSMGIASEVMPDPVFGLAVPEVERGGAVLVNVRPSRGGREAIDVVANAARSCEEAGAELRCVAMSDEDESVMSALQNSGDLPRCGVSAPRSLDEFSAAAAGAGFAIGMRLHFGILSMMSGLRVAMFPYDPKVLCFARDWGAELLNRGNAGEKFDIIKLLTNSLFGDKRKFEKARLLVAGQFKAAAGCLLGDDDGRCTARRARANRL
jgi:polysaccharide pyruvyl transferase CsaB